MGRFGRGSHLSDYISFENGYAPVRYPQPIFVLVFPSVFQLSSYNCSNTYTALYPQGFWDRLLFSTLVFLFRCLHSLHLSFPQRGWALVLDLSDAASSLSWRIAVGAMPKPLFLMSYLFSLAPHALTRATNKVEEPHWIVCLLTRNSIRPSFFIMVLKRE